MAHREKRQINDFFEEPAKRIAVDTSPTHTIFFSCIFSKNHAYATAIQAFATASSGIVHFDEFCTYITFSTDTFFQQFKKTICENLNLRFEKAGYSVTSTGEVDQFGSELPPTNTITCHTFHIY